jgi:alpha-beta hydrolase superfamily lysophospholipase
MKESVISKGPAGVVEPGFRKEIWPWFTSARKCGELRPEYQIGGATVQSTLQLVRLSRAAMAAAAKIQAPTLLLQAGRDRMVRNDAQDRAVKSIRHCRKVIMAEANHVIMQEVDPVRGQALAAIRGFLQEQVNGRNV